jgi:ABC-2 type transport system ATP-binding protein
VVHANGLKPWYSQSETLLVAEDLRKTYGARVALRKLSFTLQAGHVMGFLGPNGAGKTTAIRILTTMLEPTSGRFVVGGLNSENPEKIRQVIGVLPEGQGFPKHITGLDYLVYFAQLYGQTNSEARNIGLALLQDVGMQQRGDALIGTYSHGMRQRLGIARALVNDPKVLFLDEPTLGLDPRGQHELLALIQRIARERNTGVILSSHLLSEIEGICDDVIIMNSGEVVAHGTVAEVIGQTLLSANQRNTLRIRVPPPSLPQAQQILEELPDIQQVTPADEIGGWLALELVQRTGTDEAEDPLAKNRILEALMKAEIPILGFEILGGRLQDVFLELTAEAIG